jgi:D-lyxose ketol-isomerase
VKEEKNMTAVERKKLRDKTCEVLNKANIIITEQEKENIEIADLGLNDIEHIGLQIVVYENNDRYCAKELILLPRQLCPEHRHPPMDAQNAGKQETFRCRWGEVYLYVPGDATPNPRANVPEKYRRHLHVWKEIVLKPGDQYTLKPDTFHWFQAGDEGAIVSEFSSASHDETDIFSDPNIRRV